MIDNHSINKKEEIKEAHQEHPKARVLANKSSSPSETKKLTRTANVSSSREVASVRIHPASCAREKEIPVELEALRVAETNPKISSLVRSVVEMKTRSDRILTR